MPSGRLPNAALRIKVKQLARAGLSGSAIGKRLGVSRQHVHKLLNGKSSKPSPAVTLVCAGCGLIVAQATPNYRDLKPVLCPRCLENYPRVRFGVRIRLLRLAKGWTLTEFARRCGITSASLSSYELGTTMPRPKRAEQLIALLGRH